MQGEHVCTVEDSVTELWFQVHNARMRPYADASKDVTEELMEMMARIQGEDDELPMADIIKLDTWTRDRARC